MPRVVLNWVCAGLILFAWGPANPVDVGISRAHAQLSLDAFRPAETVEDGFYVHRPIDRGDGRLSARIVADYALNPLAMRGDASTGGRDLQIVAHELVSHLQLAIGLWNRVVLSAGLPVHLMMQGEHMLNQPVADGPGMGDANLAARVRVLGERHSDIALALAITTTLPTARWADSRQFFRGERDWTVHPELLLELRPGDVRVTLNSGIRFRAAEPVEWQSVILDHQLTGALAVDIPMVSERFDIECGARPGGVHDVLGLAFELFGATPLEHLGDSESSPFEALAGLRASPRRELSFGVAAGAGLAPGAGASEFRAVLTFDIAEPAEGEVACSAPPRRIPTPPARPVQSESHGAPVPRHPRAASQLTGSPATESTSPATESTSPATESTESRSEPAPSPALPNAAPELVDSAGVDADGDGVPDREDACPDEPGVAGEHQGCSHALRVDPERGMLELLEGLEFSPQSATIRGRNIARLERMAAYIEAHPALRRIRVEGHTDDRGREGHNLRLSRRRATAVVDWLVTHGVAPERLEASGCGELHPLGSNRTASGRALNRRIEFHVLDPAAPDPVVRSGCLAARSISSRH